MDGSERPFFRQAIYSVLLHLVDVSNRIHRNAEISITWKLKCYSVCVMLLHNKWGIPEKAETGTGIGALFPGWVVFMRDVLAVTSVIVLAVCLGVTAAYLSVDLTPPGLDLIRPPKPAVMAQMEREKKQSTIQAEASECKYCLAVAELAQTFARHAKGARQQADSLHEAMSLDKKARSRIEELKIAERSADSAEAAAASLTRWASRCKAEDFCRVPVTRASTVACHADATGSVSASLLLASAVRKVANSCAEASCPSVDCQSTTALRNDVQFVERSLDNAGGRFNTLTNGSNAGQLPVGASTLKSELKRVGDEAIYVTKMLPLMLDNTSANGANGNLPKLASDMVDERAVSTAQLAAVMQSAADVSDGSGSDPRREAAWRLKSLAANLAALGKQTQVAEGGQINWQNATDSLGAALFDLARLQAMLDRVSDATPAAEGCNASAPAAAQQLREAVAMLDLCRTRSACTNRNSLGAAQASRNASEVVARAQAAAEVMVVNEIAGSDLVQASDSTQVEAPIQVLRSQQGVCVRAAELREASSAAPVIAQAVAQSVVPGVQVVVGPVAPQDLVMGVVHAAVGGPETMSPDGGASVVEASAPVARTPDTDSEIIPAAAPAVGATSAFTGNMLTRSPPASLVGVDPVSGEIVAPKRP